MLRKLIKAIELARQSPRGEFRPVLEAFPCDGGYPGPVNILLPVQRYFRRSWRARFAEAWAEVQHARLG